MGSWLLKEGRVRRERHMQEMFHLTFLSQLLMISATTDIIRE